MERKFQPKIKMIVGVSNIWMQDILTEIVDEDRYEMVFSRDLRQEDLSCHKIVVVDIDDYPVRCSQLFQEIISQRPGIGIVAIVSDSVAYGEKITQMGANAVVGKDELVDRFADVLETLVHGLWLEGQTRRLLRVKNFIKKEKNAVKKTTENKSGFFKPISRRTFLTGSAATMAALALTACASTDETQEQTTAGTTEEATTAGTTAGQEEPISVPDEQNYCQACRGNCFAGCRLNVKVRDGRVVGTSMLEFPDPRYNRICARGLSHTNFIYGTERIQHPMKRVGARGAGQWEQITWDEAIKEITDAWKSYQKQYGNSSVAFMRGSGNAGSIAFNAGGRLKAVMGGTTVDACVDNNTFTGTVNAFGAWENYNGNEMADLLEAKTILLWGTNPCDAQIQNWKFIRQAQKKGAKIICIDPNFTTTAARSDIHVPVKPGSDGLLALAMCNIVIEKGWIDETFLKNQSVAPFLVKKDGSYLRMSEVTGEVPAEGAMDMICVWDADANAVGSSAEVKNPALQGTFKVNGVSVTTAYELLLERIAEYTVDRAAKECELPEALIYQIAEIYATNTPSTLYHGFGPDHYTNGHSAVFAACCLAILTGNVAKTGASAGFQMPVGLYINPALTTPAGSVPGPTVPIVKLPEVMEEKTFMDQPLDIRSIFVYIANPIANTSNRKRLIEAFDKMDLVVVADINMGDTARYADIVLPVCHWFEMDDMCTSTQAPYIMRVEKAMDPLYESKTDLEIVNMLGQAMGLTELFSLDTEAWLKEALDTDMARAMNVTYERLKEEKILYQLTASPYIYGNTGFMTATGRAQFYLENPAPNLNYGQEINVELERLPYWEAPTEAWTGTDLAEKYPLIYGQERPKYRVHTMWGYSEWMHELDPEPIVKINPKDATVRGIKEGDSVKLYNDRGYVVLKAVISNGTRPGMVVVPKGWQKGQFEDGHYQDLTEMFFNPTSVNNCYYDARVEIEKV